MDGLTKEKNDRLKCLKQLTKMDEQLCARLAMTPHYVPSGTVPSTQQLAELEEHIRGLEAEQVGEVDQFPSALHSHSDAYYAVVFKLYVCCSTEYKN